MKKRKRILLIILIIIVVILIGFVIYGRIPKHVNFDEPTATTSDKLYAYKLTKDGFCRDFTVYKNEKSGIKIGDFHMCEDNIGKFEHEGNWLIIEMGSGCTQYKKNLITGKEQFFEHQPCLGGLEKISIFNKIILRIFE